MTQKVCCCSVLQYVAVFRSVLQRVVVTRLRRELERLQCDRMCVLQCVVVCRGVSQCVAV